MRIGVDLGGTKIEAIALSEAGGELLRRRVPTPAGDYQAILRAITSLVLEIESAVGERGSVGIGTPGALSPATGLIKNSNSIALTDKPLDRDLEGLLARPLRFANDANCFALSEAVDGAAAGAEVVFGVILGTGTGGGIVARGRVRTGRNAIAGEWGHNPLPWPRAEELPGPPCYCGKQGCIETFLSGPGIQRDQERRTGERLSAEAIASRARGGDTSALETLELYEDRLARGLASVINVLDPDAIVLGGGLSNIDRLYQGVPKRWGSYVFSDRVTTLLSKAKHGDASGVRGAAWLWPREEEGAG
jgi:fructokinase